MFARTRTQSIVVPADETLIEMVWEIARMGGLEYVRSTVTLESVEITFRGKQRNFDLTTVGFVAAGLALAF